MKKKRAGFAALLCTLLIVLDQITKALTVSVLKVHDIVVIPGVLTLTYVENRGVQENDIVYRRSKTLRCRKTGATVNGSTLWRRPYTGGRRCNIRIV